jgi:L-seryl-tRNA(Ser) seleniumtransferase
MNNPKLEYLTVDYGRLLILESVRTTLEKIRQECSSGQQLPDEAELYARVKLQLLEWTKPTLVPVINATGVILHTNLGRAPISVAALQATMDVATGYSNLEYDLKRGKRGSRLIHAEVLLTRITGGEAALVVNNNAAAVLLVLTALARRRGVVIARSQLVEIGGGFRVPDVMKQSGARLIEVGTTNRVNIRDYEGALSERPAVFLRAHRSNFRITGFTSEPELHEIVALAHQSGIPVVDDLGSGSLLDTAQYGLGHEPMVQESLKAGIDLVCFSGDKLLGGPQAGVIVGRKDLVLKLSKHPLARAIRADKLALTALSATLTVYLNGRAEEEIPIWRMISQTEALLHKKALQWTAFLEEKGLEASSLPGESTIGGGSLPGETLPTHLVGIRVKSPEHFMKKLRSTQPPVIARIHEDMVVFDPRTVLSDQEETLLKLIVDSVT